MRGMTMALWCVLVTAPAVFAQTTATTQPPKPAPPARAEEPSPGPNFTRELTNVHVELTLTDHFNSGPPAKKTVSMIVASGSWGRIRSSGPRAPQQMGLNVDARPFVSVDGQIQVELVLYYYPPTLGGSQAPVDPTELNQQMTVVLRDGKPMTISQAADPASDRKVTVEAKATILK